MTPSPSKQELVREIRELKALVRDLSAKVEELSVQGGSNNQLLKLGKGPKEKYARLTLANEKESTDLTIIGARVELPTSAKYGKRGNRGTVYDFDDHYVYVALENQKCTTKREPQNLRYV